MSSSLQAALAYFGIMLLATSLASLPLTPPTLLAVKELSPLVVAAIGGTAGGIAAYFDHWAIRKFFKIATVAKLTDTRVYQLAARAATVAPWITTFGFAALPLPFTAVRIMMPSSGMNVHRYASAVTLGRALKLFVIAWVGRALDLPTSWLIAALVVSLAIALVAALTRWIQSRTT